jgi:mono/diheme cytochrome c family protein
MKNLYLILILLAIVSCDRHRNHPGWDYFPDMFYSTAYESYTENPNFKDSMTMRTPVRGSVPRDHVPFEYTIAADSRAEAGIDLSNPLQRNDDNLTLGKGAYEIFCSVCHGQTGNGDGHLFTSGLYPMKPRPIAGPGAAQLKDGEIYHTITVGFGSMGAYSSQVVPDDRWRIVMYIRQLQENVR